MAMTINPPLVNSPLDGVHFDFLAPVTISNELCGTPTLEDPCARQFSYLPS
jgi:hypothetical protein